MNHLRKYAHHQFGNLRDIGVRIFGRGFRKLAKRELARLRATGVRVTAGRAGRLAQRKSRQLLVAGDRLTGGRLRASSKRLLVAGLRFSMHQPALRNSVRLVLKPLPSLATRLRDVVWRSSPVEKPRLPRSQVYVVLVNSLYQTAFGRAPSPREALESVRRLRSGEQLNSLAESLTHSAEFQAIYGTGWKADLTYVRTIYQRLQKDPEPDQLAAWLSEAEKGATRGSVLARTVSSEEALNDEISPVPKDAINDVQWIATFDAITCLDRELHLLNCSGLFDEAYYIESNPDVAAAGISPLEHFFYVGTYEGRQPNALFDPVYYSSSYPDPAGANINPAVHYFVQGAAEGRNPSGDFDTFFYLKTYPDVAASGANPLVHFLRSGCDEGRLAVSPESGKDPLLHLRWRAARAHQKQIALAYRPWVSLLMPTYNTAPIYLEAAARSVLEQAYPNWELRIVDDGSSNPATLQALSRMASWDDRINYTHNEKNQGISGATNDALYSARGEFVAMLDHDDALTADALYEMVLLLNTDPTIDAIYSDQDFILPNGQPDGNFFKPDWSPVMFRGVMFVGHLLAVRRTLALEAGGFNSEFDFAQDFEFMLRVSERTRKIHHIPKVLYHWRKIPESVASGGKDKTVIEGLQVRAVQQQLERLGLKGTVKSNPKQFHRALIDPSSDFSVADCDVFVLDSGNPPIDWKAFLASLDRAARQIRRVSIPDSWRSSGAENTVGRFQWRARSGGSCEAEEFSKFLRDSPADFILTISGNIRVESANWIEPLAVMAQGADVAAVCPLVLDVDGRVAHAGLTLTPDGEVIPCLRGFPPDLDGYGGSLSCAREVVTMWSEVALLSRSVVLPLLPEKSPYITADFFVVDLLLRGTRSGARAIYVPQIRARRVAEANDDPDRKLDARVQLDIWAGEDPRDPFYNPNFWRGRGDYS